MKALLTAIFVALLPAAGLRAARAAPVRAACVMHFDGDWRVAGGLPEKAMLIGLQGLANRGAPRFYIVQAPSYQWEITGPLCDFYRSAYGVAFTEVASADQALSLFGRYVRGYVVWDRNAPTSLNVAFTIAGLEDALVVDDELIPLAERHGLRRIEDLRGRYTGKTDAQITSDARDRYWARCNHDSIILMGGQSGPIRVPGMADWGVQGRMFFENLSADPGHPDELALERRFMADLNPNGTIFGWHPYGKDTEEEHTTLLSTYGLKMEGLQSLPNLSFNSQFTFTPGFRFTNNHTIARDAHPVAGRKAYLSFIQSDGVGLGVWTKPGRGRIPLAWGAIMSWVKYSPAALEYFHESATPKDYFIGGLSGPAYMYPNHIPAARFGPLMHEARDLMAVLDERIFEIMDNSAADGNVGNADLTKETVDRYYREFPDVIGFVNGYGPARTRDLRDGRPMISYDYYVDPGRPREEVAADLDELIALNPIRPYFCLVHVRETNDVNSLIEAIGSLHGPVEVVPLDRFMRLAAGAKTYVTRYQHPDDPKHFTAFDATPKKAP